MSSITIPANLSGIDEGHIQRIAEMAGANLDFGADRLHRDPNPLWTGLVNTGTQLWLDTGDMEAAEDLWAGDFAALTTNNSLLNNEIQKGIYDTFIRDAADAVAGLDKQTQVLEIAFLLNARHGLRLASRFGGKVSVELHTDLAHDVERSVFYGLRYMAICPEHFVVKIPFTASGLISTKRLRDAGVPINHTLGFSARQNHLIASACAPNWCNLFLGRCNGYISGNDMGPGENVGEKAMLASQRTVRAVNGLYGTSVQHIAASMRDAGQVRELAGCDTYTMPTKVAAAAVEELDGTWRDCTNDDPAVTITKDQALAATLWEVDDATATLAKSLAADLPSTAEDLIDRAHELGAGALFPHWTSQEIATIAEDGKIPVHAHWTERFAAGEVAIDTLLNAAGLAAFTSDQAALDDRIRKHLD